MYMQLTNLLHTPHFCLGTHLSHEYSACSGCAHSLPVYYTPESCIHVHTACVLHTLVVYIQLTRVHKVHLFITHLSHVLVSTQLV